MRSWKLDFKYAFEYHRLMGAGRFRSLWLAFKEAMSHQ